MGTREEGNLPPVSARESLVLQQIACSHFRSPAASSRIEEALSRPGRRLPESLSPIHTTSGRKAYEAYFQDRGRKWT